MGIESSNPQTGQQTSADSISVTISSDQTAIPVSISGGSVTIGAEVEVKNDSGNPIPVSGTVAVSNFPLIQDVNITNTSILVSGPLTDTQLRASAVPVSTTSLPLPTGASTSALQTTGNSSLSSIDAKTPALGQALAASSVPVVLTAAQLTTLTPPTIVTANIGTTNGLALDLTVNSLLKPASTLNAVTTVGSITNSVTVKADTLANQTNALKVDGSAVTQPISAASLPLPIGAATSALQTSGNSSLSSIDTKLTTTNNSLASIDAGIPSTLGQTTMSASMPVTIASDQTRLPVNLADGSSNLLQSSITTPLNIDRGLIIRNIPYKPNTFSVLSQNTTTANGKTMIGIGNTSTSIIKIKRVYLINDRTSSVTGVACSFSLQRITSLSGGTILTAVPHDTNYSLPVNIICSTNSTQLGTPSIFRIVTWSTDEWSPGTLDQEGLDHSIQYNSPFYECVENEDNITINQNQAILLRCDTNTTTGIFDLRIVFTIEG